MQYRHFLFGKTELDELYASSLVRHLAMAIVNIFVPIYLYGLGYSIPVILLFYGLKSCFHAFFAHISAKISFRLGIKKAILASSPFLILYYLLLTQASNAYVLLPAAVFLGISDALYWIPFHTYFTKSSDYKNRGKEVGIYDAFVVVASFLGPLIGVAIFAFYGFSSALLIAGAMIFASAIPLFFTKDSKPRERYRFGRLNKNLFTASFGNGLRLLADEVAWPIFVFVALGSIAVFGYLVSLGMLVSLATIAVASFLADKHKKRKMLAAASVSESALWIARAFISTLYQFVFAEIIFRIAQIIRWLPFQAIYYNKAAASKSIVRYTVQREVGIHTGVAAGALTAFAIFSLTGLLQAIFVLGVIGALMHIAIIKKEKKKRKRKTI